MSLEELKRKFILDDAEVKRNLESVVEEALQYCFVDKGGRVHVKDQNLPGKIRVQLALAARAIAGQLDSTFSPEMTVEEIGEAAGLPANQARARLSQLVDEHFAESASRGRYSANVHRVTRFFEGLKSHGGGR